MPKRSFFTSILFIIFKKQLLQGANTKNKNKFNFELTFNGFVNAEKVFFTSILFKVFKKQMLQGANTKNKSKFHFELTFNGLICKGNGWSQCSI